MLSMRNIDSGELEEEEQHEMGNMLLVIVRKRRQLDITAHGSRC